MMKSTTIYGFENHRYFVPANNPHGHCVWYGTRAERDAAVEALEEEAGARGLSDPRFARVQRRIRTESDYAWLDRLRDHGVLRANGIDGPQDSMSHEWGGGLTASEMGRRGGRAGRGEAKRRGDSEHYRALRARQTK